MTDLHGVVVYYVGEVISGIPVVLQDHLVIDVLIIKDDLTVDYITESCFTFRDFHPDNVRLSISFLFFELVLGEVIQTESVVLSLRIFLPTYFYSHFLETLRRAETWIGVSILEQRVNIFMVEWQPL